MIQGFATPEGTAVYKNKFVKKCHENHFRESLGLFFSSIGMGSYLGDSDDLTDELYECAIQKAILSGVNVLDSAINYRCQRSERSFGKALKALVDGGKIKREEVIICSKGGFMPFEENYPKDPLAYFEEKFIKPGLVKPEEISQSCHVMTPAYLENQLNQSLKNLGLETLDIYYVHNPETQLADVQRAEFRDRMRAVFEWMEEKVAEGKIRVYGTATWNGYRVGKDQADYLSLEDLNLLAREVGGEKHHFRVIQVPFNFAMPEAWIFSNQLFGKQEMSVLQAAKRLQFAVMASACLLQAKLMQKPLPDFLIPHFAPLKESSQQCLQFARSVPGVTSALVGMKQISHVEENLKTLEVPTLSEENLVLMFQKQ